jgi:hypothetical protein
MVKIISFEGAARAAKEKRAMIKQSALLGVGLFMLVSASPPPGPGEAPEGAQGGYPPCSGSLRDRCIQLNERAARTPENMALNDELGGDDEAEGPEHMAEGPPPREGDEFADNGDYPACGGDVQDRCQQGAGRGHHGGGGAGIRVVRYRPDVRLGERG